MAIPFLLDTYGNTIYNLTQWDVNQKLIVSVDQTVTIAPKVHFCNQKSEKALVVESTLSDNKIIADIPNILLQEPYRITAYVYLETDIENSSWKTIQTIEIPVRKRPKPDDYEYVDNVKIVYLSEIIKIVEALNQDVRDAESAREENENVRISNENIRTSNEIARENAESTREESESSRVAKENERISNENTRTDNENARISNENIRKTNEENRQNEESVRKLNESSRASEENKRVSAENTRIENENIRISNENERVNNENTRIQQEIQRQEKIEQAIKDTNDATKKAVDAATEVMNLKVTETVNKAVSDANNAITDANQAASSANNASDRANDLINDLEQYGAVKVSDTEPESENVDVWIDNSERDEYTLPEINDSEESEVDTWSSKKIAGELDKEKKDIAELKGDLSELCDIKISTNLVNPSTIKKDVRLANAGYEITGSSGFACSDFLDVSGKDKVTIYVNNLYSHYMNNVYIRCYSEKSSSCIQNYNHVVKSDSVAYEIELQADINFIRIVWNYQDGIETNKVYVGSDSADNFEFTSYGEKNVVICPSDETKKARGTYKTLDERLDEIESNINVNRKTILYFGDSLTQGNQDASGVARKSVLSSLLGEEWTVKNYGVGGEKSHTISARASGTWFYLDAGVTIPADGSTVDVTKHIHDMYGAQQNFGNGIYSNGYESWKTVNPCYVNGVECTLQKANASSPVTIKRNTEGDAITITRPTRIHMNSETFEKNPVLILCLGQNEGFNRDADILIGQLKGIIEFFKSDRYIVVGIPHSLSGYTWEAPINEALKKEFRKHFLDAEGYMKTPIYGGDGSTINSSYALEDAELTPTDADLTAVSNNQYPPSIMYDGIHFNHYGYEIWANLEYKLGQDLGYW